MRLRHFLAISVLTAGGLVVLPASAQSYNNRNNQSQTPVAQATKSLNEARVKLQAAKLEVQKVKDKEKAELMKKPEWAPVEAEQKKAEAAVAAAKRAAMNAAHTKPEYQALQKQRDDADKVKQQANATPQPGSDDNKVSDADLATAENNYITASMQMKAIEKQAMADDTALGDANSKLEAAKAKMAQLDAEVDDALKNDSSYQQLQQGVVQAQQQVDQAEQQVAQARQQMAQQAAQQASQSSHSYGGNNRR